MANGNEITVTIQGDSAQLVQALEKAEKSLEYFGRKSLKTEICLRNVRFGI